MEARRPLSLHERFSKMPAPVREPVKTTFARPMAARSQRVEQSIVQQQQQARLQRQNLIQERRLAPVAAMPRAAAPVYAPARATSSVVSRATVIPAGGGKGVATITTRAGKVVSTQQLRAPSRAQAVLPIPTPVAAFPFPSLFPTPFRSPYANPMAMPVFPIRPVAIQPTRGAPMSSRGRGTAAVGRGGLAGSRKPSAPVSKSALDAEMDNYFKAKESVPSKPKTNGSSLSDSELARAAGQPVPDSFQEESVEDIGVLNS